MNYFNRALDRVLVEMAGTLTLYKGLTTRSGYAKYKHNIGDTGRCIPGFLSALKIAWVYSEPELTGPPTDPSIIIAVDIDRKDVEDRSAAFVEWCTQNDQDPDVSLGFPPQWRSDGSIWTVSSGGSAHAGVSCYNNTDFVYCSSPVVYQVLRHYRNQEDWAADRHFLKST